MRQQTGIGMKAAVGAVVAALTVGLASPTAAQAPSLSWSDVVAATRAAATAVGGVTITERINQHTPGDDFWTIWTDGVRTLRSGGDPFTSAFAYTASMVVDGHPTGLLLDATHRYRSASRWAVDLTGEGSSLADPFAELGPRMLGRSTWVAENVDARGTGRGFAASALMACGPGITPCDGFALTAVTGSSYRLVPPPGRSLFPAFTAHLNADRSIASLVADRRPFGSGYPSDSWAVDVSYGAVSLATRPAGRLITLANATATVSAWQLPTGSWLRQMGRIAALRTAATRFSAVSRSRTPVQATLRYVGRLITARFGSLWRWRVVFSGPTRLFGIRHIELISSNSRAGATIRFGSSYQRARPGTWPCIDVYYSLGRLTLLLDY